ncbi:hypothetical protein RB199_33100 [Streptomyces libani]
MLAPIAAASSSASADRSGQLVEGLGAVLLQGPEDTELGGGGERRVADRGADHLIDRIARQLGVGGGLEHG